METLECLSTNPLFLLVVGAILSGIFIPWFTKRRQYKQKELELKIDIVSDLTESVMKFITDIYLFKIRKEEMQKSIDEESLEKELSKTLKDWEVRSCVICTKLHSYFPKKKKGEKDLSDDFEDLFDEIYASKKDIEDIKKEIDEKDIKGKWDMFKAVLNKFYERKGAINKEKFDYIKRRLFEWKHKIIQEILASKITGLR